MSMATSDNIDFALTFFCRTHLTKKSVPAYIGSESDKVTYLFIILS